MRYEPALNKVDLAISSIPTETKLESKVIEYLRERFNVACKEAESLDEVRRLQVLFKIITEE